jgi:hypothetical protein
MTQVCRVCGCTNFAACAGGCWWVEDDLCSSCSCPHPDWRLSYLPGAGQQVEGPFAARLLVPVCVECGEAVQVGAPA